METLDTTVLQPNRTVDTKTNEVAAQTKTQTSNILLMNPELLMAMAAIITPSAFKKFDTDTLAQISKHVSQLLSANPDAMIQYTKEEICDFMLNDQAIAVMDMTNNTLIGFAKYMIWEGVNTQGKQVMEIWTLVVGSQYQNCSYGKLIMKYFLMYLKTQFPECLLMAGITSTNINSKRLFQSLWGKLIDKPSNVNVLVPGVEFYDVSAK